MTHGLYSNGSGFQHFDWGDKLTVACGRICCMGGCCTSAGTNPATIISIIMAQLRQGDANWLEDESTRSSGGRWKEAGRIAAVSRNRSEYTFHLLLAEVYFEDYDADLCCDNLTVAACASFSSSVASASAQKSGCTWCPQRAQVYLNSGMSCTHMYPT